MLAKNFWHRIITIHLRPPHFYFLWWILQFTYCSNRVKKPCPLEKWKGNNTQVAFNQKCCSLLGMACEWNGGKNTLSSRHKTQQHESKMCLNISSLMFTVQYGPLVGETHERMAGGPRGANCWRDLEMRSMSAESQGRYLPASSATSPPYAWCALATSLLCSLHRPSIFMSYQKRLAGSKSAWKAYN